jgi:carboxymethylenebutenolidase
MYQNQDPIHELVHLYVDGAFNRRELVRRVAQKTGGLAAALAALSGFDELKAQSAPACPDGVRVPADAPDIDARDITFVSEHGVLMYAHLATPRAAGRYPGLLVVHIKDVTRRAARAGFIALGVDLLSRQGGVHTFPEPTQQTAAYNRTTQYERRSDLIAGLNYIKHVPNIEHDRIGMFGFCAGGANTWDFAVNVPELAAAAPFYGAPPVLEDVERIQMPVLAIYAERDRTLTQRLFPVADAMIRQQKTFGMVVYEGVGHAFHNDTGNAYDPAAACDAWGRTVAFFNRHLRRPRT